MSARASAEHAPAAVADTNQGNTTAVFASIVLHVLFAGLVAIIGIDAVGAGKRPAAPLVVADWTPPPAATVVGAPPELPVPGGALVVAGPAARARVDAATAAADAAAQLDRLAPAPRAASHVPAPRLVQGLGFGAAPADAPRAAGFAADRARVAFILDASSLLVPTMQAAHRELARRLAQLTPDQTYAVVVVRGNGCETVPGTPALATRASLERTVRWLAERTEPQGRADLARALQCAWAAMDPDAVCIVARGVAAPQRTIAARRARERAASSTLLEAAERLNPARADGRRAIFLCIELLDESPGGLLRALGQTHGGAAGYQLLDRTELGLSLRPVAGQGAPLTGKSP